MSDDALSFDDFQAAGLDGWRLILGSVRTRFLTGDFASGLELARRIGEAAEAANHHPELALRYGELDVTLSSHDVDAITGRDVELARGISVLAAELGIRSDPLAVTVVELGLDTEDASPHGALYAALLGGEVDGRGEVRDPAGGAPTVWWQTPDRTGSASSTPLPAPQVEQRWHLDVWVAPDAAPARLQAVLDAGGRLVSDAAAPSFWVVEDADGNRSCICTDADRS